MTKWFEISENRMPKDEKIFGEKRNILRKNFSVIQVSDKKTGNNAKKNKIYQKCKF